MESKVISMEKNIADQAVEAYIAMLNITISFNWPLKTDGNGLPTSHFGVLHELQMQGRMNLTQLAQQVSVAKQTMTDISTKLIKMGYVRRIQDEHNRRQILLELTPEGKAYVENSDHDRFLYLRDQVFSSLSEEQLHQLHEACHTLCKLQTQTLIGEKFGNRGLTE